MGFTDLPEDWADRPLTDPRLVDDVLDLVVSDRDRHDGALGVLVCDEEHRLIMPIVIGELGEMRSEADRHTGLHNLVRAITTQATTEVGRPGIHLAIARRIGLSITSEDIRWRDAAEAACGSALTLLGVHIVTTEGSRPVPAQWRDDEARSSSLRDAS